MVELMKHNITLQQAEHFAKTGKVCLVMLKKEGEGFVLTTDKQTLAEYSEGKEITNKDAKLWNELWTDKGKGKCQVGRSYVLCSKGKALWWCPECKELYLPKKLGGGKYSESMYQIEPHNCGLREPFRFKVESIEEKRLLDVMGEESRLAGIEYFEDLVLDLLKQSKSKLKYEYKFLRQLAEDWNPEVFVVKGKVIL